MKAIRIHGRGGPDHLVYEDVPPPHPDPGEVLVRVYAAGVIATELQWDETYQTEAGSPRALPIPGPDLSGVVEEIGSGITALARGDEVYAMLGYGRDGAEAEFTIALPSELAPKPRTLDHVQAAAVPLTALTAWQALFVHARLAAGQTILIHGAAGGVGVFAVQLARWAGAHVIATASARNHDFLRELGANEIIDHTTTRRVPKRDTSQPVIGVTTAVARMLNVIAQAISSCVADSAPCICGRTVDVVSSAVP